MRSVHGYRLIPSLAHYLLVSQTEPYVEWYRRQDDGSWRYEVIEADGRLHLSDPIGLEVDSIYEGIFELPDD